MSAEWCPVRVRIGGADRETHNAKLNLMFLFNLAVRINLQSFSEGQNQAAEDTSAASSVSPPIHPPHPTVKCHCGAEKNNTLNSDSHSALEHAGTAMTCRYQPQFRR